MVSCTVLFSSTATACPELRREGDSFLQAVLLECTLLHSEGIKASTSAEFEVNKLSFWHFQVFQTLNKLYECIHYTLLNKHLEFIWSSEFLDSSSVQVHVKLPLILCQAPLNKVWCCSLGLYFPMLYLSIGNTFRLFYYLICFSKFCCSYCFCTIFQNFAWFPSHKPIHQRT